LATQIHPTAIVEPGAQLGIDCEIQAYAVVTRHCQLGDRVVVYPHAVVGGDPQYLKFDRQLSTGVKIGAGTVVREHATINRSIRPGEATTVGENCFLMAASHVGHDSAVGHHVVLGNAVLLGGHVLVGDHTFIGGSSGVHQYVRVGEGVMVGGGARISQDLAPFTLVAERNAIAGLNLIGLKRRGVSRDAIRELKEIFRIVFSTTGNIREVAAEQLRTGLAQSEEGKRFLAFFAEGKRGFARPARSSGGDDVDEA
jgi:UDP-N-acetylglucosamine acyltransferase